MKVVPEIIYRWGGSGFKLHRALTDHPTDILATKPVGKYSYGMGRGVNSWVVFDLPTPLDLNFSDFEFKTTMGVGYRLPQ